MMIGRLQLIVSIYDHERLSDKGKCRVYTGALVVLHRLKNNGEVDQTHEMFEVEAISINKSKRPRELHSHRFFEMHDILRSAHIVPTEREGHYYVNNFVDWDQYNIIYDPDFMAKGIRVADKFAEQIHL